MPYSDIYLYSPLTIKTIKEGQNRALLLQFILSELFYAMDADKKDDPLEFVFSSPACFFPYDWSYEVGSLNKIKEHAKLLPIAFPKLNKAIISFDLHLDEVLSKVLTSKNKKEEIPKEVLSADLNELYQLLQPFIIACKDSENLLLFLIKHPEEIAQLSQPENLSSLLAKMFPEGFDNISHLIRREYKSRGFHNLLPEIDRILSHYEQ